MKRSISLMFSNSQTSPDRQCCERLLRLGGHWAWQRGRRAVQTVARPSGHGCGAPMLEGCNEPMSAAVSLETRDVTKYGASCSSGNLDVHRIARSWSLVVRLSMQSMQQRQKNSGRGRSLGAGSRLSWPTLPSTEIGRQQQTREIAEPQGPQPSPSSSHE